jgi:hypothetical protein
LKEELHGLYVETENLIKVVEIVVDHKKALDKIVSDLKATRIKIDANTN